MTKKEIFFLNADIHFISDGGWEYEIRQRHSGPIDDNNYYLWTIHEDFICQVPTEKISFENLYEFVSPIVAKYEKENH